MTHRAVDVASRCAAEFAALAQAHPIFWSTADKEAALRACVALETQIAAFRMRVMLDAADVALGNGSRDIAQWLAAAAHLYRADAARDLRLARDLQGCEVLSEALMSGAITVGQARVVVASLGRLPEEVDGGLRRQAESYLVEQAAHFGPRDLATLGEKVLEVLAPETHDALEAARLSRQEDAARAARRLTLTPRGDGLTQISGRLPDAVAVRLATYLHALANPRREGARSLFGDPDGLARLPYPQRAAEAFGQLLEVWDPARLPVHGGDATTLVVSVGLEALRTELATSGLLDAGDTEVESRISADEARRLACTARIIPVVLGSAGEVLDLARSARLFSRAQRRALLLRDRTCRAEGCSIPGTWSEAHHWMPWAKGGDTDLANAALLCSHHHHVAHSPRWVVERLSSGDVRFVRRT